MNQNIIFHFTEAKIVVKIVNALSNENIEEGLVQATGSRSGLKNASTNASGIVTLGSFIPGEKITVEVSIQGLFVDL